MKKFFSISSFLMITFFGILSCRQNDANDVTYSQKENIVASARYANLTEDELISKLVHDENFINFRNDLTRFYDVMPTKNNFSINFDNNVFDEEGTPYLALVSGYTELEIENKINDITSELEILYNRYPQLIYDGTNMEFINNIVNGVSEQTQTNKGACENCIKIHRPRVIQATLVGGASGIPGGPKSVGIRAFFALVHALNDAADCFEAAGGCGIGSTFSK